MRDADSIDPSKTPAVPRQRNATEEARHVVEQQEALDNRRITRERYTMLAEYSPEGRDFLRRCIAIVEEALDSYASGESKFECEIDEWRAVVRTSVLDIPISEAMVDVDANNWKYFRVRIVFNGVIDQSTQLVPADGFEFPLHEGYVLVIEERAPWLRDALVDLFDEHGYQRTIYVSVTPSVVNGSMTTQAHADRLTYALPTQSS